MNEALVTLTIQLAVKDVTLLVAAARRVVVFEGRSEVEAEKLVKGGDTMSAIQWILVPFQDIIPGVDIVEIGGDIGSQVFRLPRGNV